MATSNLYQTLSDLRDQHRWDTPEYCALDAMIMRHLGDEFEAGLSLANLDKAIERRERMKGLAAALASHKTAAGNPEGTVWSAPVLEGRK